MNGYFCCFLSIQFWRFEDFCVDDIILLPKSEVFGIPWMCWSVLWFEVVKRLSLYSNLYIVKIWLALTVSSHSCRGLFLGGELWLTDSAHLSIILFILDVLVILPKKLRVLWPHLGSNDLFLLEFCPFRLSSRLDEILHLFTCMYVQFRGLLRVYSRIMHLACGISS